MFQSFLKYFKYETPLVTFLWVALLFALAMRFFFYNDPVLRNLAASNALLFLGFIILIKVDRLLMTFEDILESVNRHHDANHLGEGEDEKDAG